MHFKNFYEESKQNFHKIRQGRKKNYKCKTSVQIYSKLSKS